MGCAVCAMLSTLSSRAEASRPTIVKHDTAHTPFPHPTCTILHHPTPFCPNPTSHNHPSTSKTNTPLGVKRTWDNLIAGRTGITSLSERFAHCKDELNALPSRIAGLVPRGKRAEGGWDADEWVDRGVSLLYVRVKGWDGMI